LTFGLASLILITEADQQWLVRRIEEIHDFLYDTPVYQHIMRQGREEERREQIQEMRDPARNYSGAFPENQSTCTGTGRCYLRYAVITTTDCKNCHIQDS
jgi:hypothetical protein